MSEQGKNKKKKEQVTVRSSAAEYLNYVASVGNDEQQIEMRYEDENIWLTQKLMAMLYGVEVHTINYHIKKIFIIRKSKFPQNPKRSVRFSGKGTKRSVQKRKARNTQKAETKVL